jgi:tRNA(Ile)-lysidine synthase TilS/MesJ
MNKEVTFHIFTDRDSGRLCASGVDHAIHTYARSWNKLIKNIHEAVECHFEVPYTQVKITLVESHDIEAQESRDAGTACN